MEVLEYIFNFLGLVISGFFLGYLIVILKMLIHIFWVGAFKIGHDILTVPMREKLKILPVSLFAAFMVFLFLNNDSNRDFIISVITNIFGVDMIDFIGVSIGLLLFSKAYFKQIIDQ